MHVAYPLKRLTLVFPSLHPLSVKTFMMIHVICTFRTKCRKVWGSDERPEGQAWQVTSVIELRKGNLCCLCSVPCPQHATPMARLQQHGGIGYWQKPEDPSNPIREKKPIQQPWQRLLCNTVPYHDFVTALRLNRPEHSIRARNHSVKQTEHLGHFVWFEIDMCGVFPLLDRIQSVRPVRKRKR